MARKTPLLFTVGYEQTPAHAVLKNLQNAGVKLLVDVRAVAASRRPGFSKKQLAAGLDERGIGYIHLRGLGTPRDGREAAQRQPDGARKDLSGASQDPAGARGNG